MATNRDHGGSLMANLKINDLPATGSVSASMQLETDIGGTTPNKVTAAQLRNFAINNVNQGSLGATFPASAVGKSASVRPNFAGTITSAVMTGT